MSISVPRTQLPDEDLMKRLSLSTKDAFTRQLITYKAYRVTARGVSLPFAFAVMSGVERPARAKRSSRAEFAGKLRPEQVEVKSEAMKHLRNQGSCIVGCYPGFGKTCLGIYIALALRSPKTLIVLNRVVLQDQWRESVDRFAGRRTQLLTPGEAMDPEADFYLVNAINLPKIELRVEFRLVIVDEAHLLLSPQNARALHYVEPRFLLGLSATPYREDFLNPLFSLYFGDKRIEKGLSHPHDVVPFFTQIVPQVQINPRTRKVDWSKVLESLAAHKKRNNLVLRIIGELLRVGRRPLVLSKRVKQLETLAAELRKEGTSVCVMAGKSKDDPQRGAVVLGTTSKVGTGFDVPNLDALVLVSDVRAYFVQYLGRVFRRKDVRPIVVDLVDDFGPLFGHWKERLQVYKESGGRVRRDLFPESGLAANPKEPEREKLLLIKAPKSERKKK